MAEGTLSGRDYHNFNVSGYLKTHYGDPSRAIISAAALRCYHDTFQSLPSGLRVLDYGTGPAIVTTISAATKASYIVLSDYAEQNRVAVREWLEKKEGSFDWSPYFCLVVNEMEGKDAEEVQKRQDQIRRLVKAVVHCDLTQDPPIDERYNEEYDVVISSLVLEVVSQSSEDYKTNIKKLAKLVKLGGSLFLYGAESIGSGFYLAGDQKFKAFSVSKAHAIEAMTEAGFSNISCEKVDASPERAGVVWSHNFFKGIKSKN